MNYQEAIAFMSKARDISKGRPTNQRGTRMSFRMDSKSNMPIVELSYHDTSLVVWKHDRTAFRNDGWMTQTTKNRINQHLPPHMIIYQRNHRWYLRVADTQTHEPAKETLLPYDFMFAITPDGKVVY